MLKLIAGMTLGLSLIFNQLAIAKEYPTRPITVIIPFDVGGAIDPVMRVIGEYLQKKHDITLVIINKPTGGGAPAMLDVMRARPDGHTIGFTSAAVLTVLPQYKNVGFKYTDLRHVCQIITLNMGWVVRDDSPIKSLDDLMQKAQSEKGKYNIASPGAFTAQRFFHAKVMENFPNADLPYVSYDGSGAVVAAILGGHVSAGYIPVASYITQKKLRTIAISSSERDPNLPEVPTFAEILGHEYVYNSACGIVAPPKTPEPIIKKLEGLVADALSDAEVQKKLARFGATPNFLPSTDFTKVLYNYASFFEKPINDAIKASQQQ